MLLRREHAAQPVVQHVIPHLRPDAARPQPGEPDPVDHLREYNNYLSPRLGFFSADTWTLAATVGRNILLNWLVLIPLFMAALMIPRLLLSIARLGEASLEIHGTADPIATSPAVIYGLPLLSGLLLAISIFNTGRYLPGLGGRDHSQGDFLAKVLAPLVVAALCFTAFDSLYFWGDKDIPTTIPQLVTWILVPCSLGWLAFLAFCGRGMRRGARGLIGPLSLALNVVSGERLAWQQRKAQAFSVSPLYCGNFELGYRDSAQYGGPDGISLGTAVTISGAAASPNMGYHSSPIVGLIMTLLNARLGAWLGNPGVAGNSTWTESGPRTAIGSLVKEAFGLTTNTSAYV